MLCWAALAYMLFAHTGQPLEVIANEAYSLLISHSIPAIPLFTFTGFILSESKAGERFVRLFKAVFSWFPGGLAIMAILVCTFFTTFTGASGVTILAVGGLLSYVLIKRPIQEKIQQRAAYRDRKHRPALSAQPARHHLRSHGANQH